MSNDRCDFHSDAAQDVISLETNRRVTAALQCAERTARLLLLNGSSETEQLHVDLVVPAAEPVCRGSFALEPGKHLIIDLARPSAEAPFRVHVLGGPEPMFLEERLPAVRRGPAIFVLGSILAGAIALAGTIAHFTHDRTVPTPVAVAPRAHVAIAHAPAPHARAARTVVAHAALAPRTPPAHRVPVPPAPQARVASHPPRPAARIPRPRFIALGAPRVAFAGEAIPVAFRTDGSQVRIVAKIGPRTVEERIIGASHGKLVLDPLPASARTRILTVDAWGQNGDRSASRNATVVLIPTQAPGSGSAPSSQAIRSAVVYGSAPRPRPSARPTAASIRPASRPTTS